ncbi:MAG: hypothetical protein FJ011_25650 [Chloroflexi bacterium]|nr:hypothetical protein [Chloroflexota bacterium]
MSTGFAIAVEPLVRRQIFATEEQAARELVRNYVLRQIAALQREVARFERKYGMPFERFSEYLHEHSTLLETSLLEPGQRQALGRAIMQEEDDWLAWKASQEMLESWVGMRREVTS